MQRSIVAVIFLVATMNHASAGLLVSSAKVGSKFVSGTNFDIWSVAVTGFDGVHDVPGNYVQRVEFAPTAATPDFGLTAVDTAVLSVKGTNATNVKTNFSMALMGGGDGTFNGTAGTGSWLNFESFAGTFTRTGTATATTKVTGTMFAGDPEANGLRPVDVTVGGEDDGIDETLFGQIFVSAGGSATFAGNVSFKYGAIAPFTFSVGGNSATTDPILVTSTPASGTTLSAGQTATIANATAVAGRFRDVATLSNYLISTNAGSAGAFSGSGGAWSGILAPGAAKSTNISLDSSGLLNGFTAKGNLHFDVASGTNGAGTGAGAYDFPLMTTVSGKTGDGKAPVPAGGSYAGLSSTSGLVSKGALIHLPSMATILAGDNNVNGATQVQMNWSLRAANEQKSTGVQSPLPSFADALTSDKVSITGVDDKFVIQMTYVASLMTGDELDDFNVGKLFLASFDGTKWVNAILLNSDGGASATKVLGAWSGQMTLGTWGADLNANVVWAVVDHAGLFASVPEPSSIVSCLCLLSGMATNFGLRWRIAAWKQQPSLA